MDIAPVIAQLLSAAPTVRGSSTGRPAPTDASGRSDNRSQRPQAPRRIPPADELTLSDAAQRAAGAIPPAPPSSHDAKARSRSTSLSPDNASFDSTNAAPPSSPAAEQAQPHEAPASTRPGEGELTEEEEQQVRELKQRDSEVRAHEQAHVAAAGPYARGGPSYEYQTGPDGKRYAIGGEVQIDTSAVPGDPEATIAKARIVRAAALAPAEPSAQDRAVAAAATQLEAEARSELNEQTETDRGEPSGPAEQAGASLAAVKSGTPAFSAAALSGRGLAASDTAAPDRRQATRTASLPAQAAEDDQAGRTGQLLDLVA